MGDGHVARDKDGRSAAATFLHPVAFGRPLLLSTLIGALLFLWPLLAYGRPGDFQDSASYYKGGRAAVTFVLDKMHAGDRTPASTADVKAPVVPGAQSPPQQPEQVRGRPVRRLQHRRLCSGRAACADVAAHHRAGACRRICVFGRATALRGESSRSFVEIGPARYRNTGCVRVVRDRPRHLRRARDRRHHVLCDRVRIVKSWRPDHVRTHRGGRKSHSMRATSRSRLG